MRIEPNNGPINDELEKKTVLYNARLVQPTFAVEELTNEVSAWIVKPRFGGLTPSEVVEAFKEEVCRENDRIWTGFYPPKPEGVKLGRLRHLLGKRTDFHEGPRSRSFSGQFGHDGDCDEYVLAAGDIWTPPVNFCSHDFSPILHCSNQLVCVDLLDTAYQKVISDKIWWLFVGS